MPGRKMSGYQKNVQRIAILENAINEAIGVIESPKDMGSKWIDDAKEAKSILLAAIVRIYNL